VFDSKDTVLKHSPAPIFCSHHLCLLDEYESMLECTFYSSFMLRVTVKLNVRLKVSSERESEA